MKQLMQGGGSDRFWRLESGVCPASLQEDKKDRKKTEQGHARPFQSAAAVSHGSRASRGEAPS